MTEKSMFWTTGVSGDGLNKYNADSWMLLMRSMLVGNYLAAYGWGGILPSPVASEHLAVSGTATPVSIQKGWACVYGLMYQNDAAATLAVPTPVINTTGKSVVLRANWTTRQVRLALITSSDGDSAFPAVTQTPGSIYEIKLCNMTVTTGGVITITDVRRFLGFNSNIHRGHLGGDTSNEDLAAVVSAGINIEATTFFQSGVSRWTGGSATSGNFTITFPETFTSRPLVVVTPLDATGVTVRAAPAVGGAAFILYWAATSAKTQLDFMWLALGFIGNNS